MTADNEMPVRNAFDALARGDVELMLEVVSFGQRVLVVTRSPGLDEQRARKPGDRNFHVVTVRGERITGLRACRSRQEAAALASTQGSGRRATSQPAGWNSIR